MEHRVSRHAETSASGTRDSRRSFSASVRCAGTAQENRNAKEPTKPSSESAETRRGGGRFDRRQKRGLKSALERDLRHLEKPEGGEQIGQPESSACVDRSNCFAVLALEDNSDFINVFDVPRRKLRNHVRCGPGNGSASRNQGVEQLRGPRTITRAQQTPRSPISHPCLARLMSPAAETSPVLPPQQACSADLPAILLRDSVPAKSY